MKISEKTVHVERDGNNVVTASLTRTGNIGGILARTTDAGSVFYGYDGNGNVVTLTGSSGAEVGSYTYDAFGNIVATSGAAAGENPYRFSTKEQIGGLYSYGFRFYSPGLGRWINRDPIGEAGGTNLYMFAGNDPVNLGDEYGLFSTPWWLTKKGWDDWLTPPGNPCSDDEWGEVERLEATEQHAVKRSAQAWVTGSEAYMAIAPVPSARGAGRIFGRSGSTALGQTMRRAGSNQLSRLGLKNVKLFKASYNAGRKQLERAGFRFSHTSPTGRRWLVNDKTGAQIAYDSGKALAPGQKPHWHIMDQAGQKFSRSGRPVGRSEGAGHIPAR